MLKHVLHADGAPLRRPCPANTAAALRVRPSNRHARYFDATSAIRADGGVEAGNRGKRQECLSVQFAAKRGGRKLWCQGNGADYLAMLETVENSGGKMPEPRAVPGVERLSSSLSEEALFHRFMREFGTDDHFDFTDVTGNVLKIDRNLFLNLKGDWKILKGQRAQWLLYTATNIKRPDEIWHEPGRCGGADKLYYLSRFDVGRRGLLACVAVFERAQGANGAWAGRTNYATTQDGYVERKRNQEIMKGEIKYWRWE